MTIAEHITNLVLAVHRRNGGRMEHLDMGWRLLEPALGLDSLDLAEIMVGIEKEFGVAPFNQERTPATWADVIQTCEKRTGLH